MTTLTKDYIEGILDGVFETLLFTETCIIDAEKYFEYSIKQKEDNLKNINKIKNRQPKQPKQKFEIKYITLPKPFEQYEFYISEKGDYRI